MSLIPHYCQGCGAGNPQGERECRQCGTRLMIVVFPPAVRHDDGIIPSFYEDHLLERVSLLELRISQLAERLSTALDLLLRQTKTSNSDHVLLEALISALDMDSNLTESRRIKESDGNREDEAAGNERLFLRITKSVAMEKLPRLSKLLNDSFALLAESNEKEALKLLRQALSIIPHNIHLRLLAAETSFRVSKYETAISILQSENQAAADHPAFRLLLGVLFADLGEPERAADYLKAIPKNDEAAFCANYVVGLLSVVAGEWQEARKAFRIAARVKPSAELSYLLGCVSFQLKKNKNAVKHLRRAIEIDTNFTDAWFMLSVVLADAAEDATSAFCRDRARTTKDAGAESSRYLIGDHEFDRSLALPFIRLKDSPKHPIMRGPGRFSNLVFDEIYRLIRN